MDLLQDITATKIYTLNIFSARKISPENAYTAEIKQHDVIQIAAICMENAGPKPRLMRTWCVSFVCRLVASVHLVSNQV